MKPSNLLAREAGPAIVFVAWLAVLTGVATYVLGNGYTNVYAISNWAKSVSIMDSGDFRLEYFGLGYPHVPFYALVPFHLLPFVDGPFAPYFVSSAAGATLLACAYRDARRYGYSLPWSAGLVAGAGAHCVFLWSASSGTQMAMSMTLYYWIAMAVSDIPGRVNLSAYIRLGLLLAVLFFVDAGSIYLVAALAVMVPLLMHRSISERTPAGFYLIVFMPFAIAALSWVYLNWLFFLDPLYFLKAEDSAFLGAWEISMYVDWLLHYGGTFLVPLFFAVAAGLILFPALPLLAVMSARKDYLYQTFLAVVLTPLLATAFSTFTNFLETPYQFLHLMVPGVLAVAIFFGRAGHRAGYSVLAALALGAFLSWPGMALFGQSKDVAGWVHALRGQPQESPHTDQVRLGKWLNDHRGPTLMDDNGAYFVIAARGDGRELILPFMHHFKLNLLYREARAEFVVLPSPSTANGKKNKLNQRYPKFFTEGMIGYELAYDQVGWRVYRRVPPA